MLLGLQFRTRGLQLHRLYHKHRYVVVQQQNNRPNQIFYVESINRNDRRSFRWTRVVPSIASNSRCYRCSENTCSPSLYSCWSSHCDSCRFPISRKDQIVFVFHFCTSTPTIRSVPSACPRDRSGTAPARVLPL